ncbi:hypothetical protein BRADI_3g28230v3 [Brachypodium distachyon]|uniref:Myb/SANT-like domain-containing protein n=1 Tax=Brachypodium distachyon TaxID=15368 RepID=A0A0Q3FCM8_BRADI|nr:hypothetical protein BRADI_3g28230v3 [Brachypodium distachyon]
MAGNNVVWQPQVVEEMLHYYKEKFQSEGKQFIFKELHHEDCAKQINTKFGTVFTQRQVYHKFHKLKAQWKNKDKRAKCINVPIASFDDMEYVFQDKHATGEFSVLQTPYDHVSSRDKDFVGDKNVSDADVDPATQYDSDCLPEDTNSESSSSKCPRGGSRDKGKRVKCDDSVITDMTHSLHDMSEIMRFTHTSLATNEQVASMLKGRPMHSIKEWVRRWVADNYPSYVRTNM